MKIAAKAAGASSNIAIRSEAGMAPPSTARQHKGGEQVAKQQKDVSPKVPPYGCASGAAAAEVGHQSGQKEGKQQGSQGQQQPNGESGVGNAQRGRGQSIASRLTPYIAVLRTAADWTTDLRNSSGHYNPKLRFWRIPSIARAADKRPHRGDFGRGHINGRMSAVAPRSPRPASPFRANSGNSNLPTKATPKNS